MANILFISYEERRKRFLNSILGSEYFIIMGDVNYKNKIDNLIPLIDLVIIDFSSLRWEALDVVHRLKDYPVPVLGMGKEVNKEIIQAARERGLAEYIDVEKGLGFISKFIRERTEKEMLISKVKEEKKAVKEYSPSFLFKEKGGIFYSEQWQFLEEISHFLIHGYNLRELMQFFLDLLAKMFGVTRICFLLKDRIKNSYQIKASIGIPEEVKNHVQLFAHQGLAEFLTRKGTVVTNRSILQINFETAYRIKQEMKLIQSSVVFPLSPQGELIGMLGLGQKITGEELSSLEIKQIFLLCNQIGLAVQNLLFYEEMFCQKKYIENVLKNASSGVISINEDHKITTCNPRAKRILNLESQDLIGKDIRELPSPVGDLLFETLTLGTRYERKEVYIPGIKRWVGISTNQIKDAEEKVIGSIMIFTDLTPIKHLQREKEKMQKRDFLAQVAVRLSHELRNSFVPIKSLAELLSSKYLDREFQEKFFHVVKTEVERIDNLIERLVFFSQPLHLYKKAESVTSIITESIDQVKKKLPSNREIQLNLTFDEEKLLVYVDRETILKAFDHIIMNSIEAVPEERVVKIDINCEIVDKIPESFLSGNWRKIDFPENGEYVRIEIKDNGEGLPHEDTNKIFDPFFTTKNKGIGLGLTISQSIIEEHGGLVVPLKKKEKGATIVVYLPRYQLPE
ncbi:MAG TPA: sensor histidine kinase [Candidatus Aerophobetes bacterium]|uniref:histidine kinase n=1 Tax=Aerophobetes bacterium TaxID=2030807 RepID=A0A7V0QSC1_UNCAE|nr:sensor histidine kinase [Candidatus Aerophobetes bacterium]